MPTNVKGGIWEFLNIHSLEKWGKNEGGPSGDIKKICEKKSHKAENKPAQKKILVMAGLEPMSVCLSDLEKAVVAKWQ